MHELFLTSGLGHPKHTPNSPVRNVLTLQPGCGHPRTSVSLAGRGLAGLTGLEEHWQRGCTWMLAEVGKVMVRGMLGEGAMRRFLCLLRRSQSRL